MFNKNNKKINSIKKIFYILSFSYLFWKLINFFEEEKPIDKTKKRLENWKESFDTKSIKKDVEESFKKISKEADKRYEKIQEDLIDRISSMVSSLKEINPEKYKKVLEEIINEYEDEGELSKAQLKKLKNNLIKDYENLKKQ